MAANKGKEFEGYFEKFCNENQIDCVRFYDTMQGFKSVSNACDFVVSQDIYSPAVLVECKSTHATSFSLDFRQYDSLIKLTHFRSKVVIWFIKLKEIWALPISSITQMKENGLKSFNQKKHSEYGTKLDVKFARVNPVSANLDDFIYS